MRVDLRFNGSIHSDLVELFDKVSFSNRETFNSVIDQVSRPLIDNIDWWAQNPASRNTYSSPLFHYYCSYKFLQEILNKKVEVREIILDSRELESIFKKVLQERKINNINILYNPGSTLKIKRLMKRFFYFQYFIIRRFIEGLIIRISDNLNKSDIQSKPITIVDTFLTIEYANNDRWYGSFWSNLDENIRKEVFFVPTVLDTPLRDISRLCNDAKKDGRNILFKDQYLEFNDFIFAYKHKERVRRLKINQILVDNYDISGLVREDIDNNRDIRTLIESLLTYRFIHKLKQSQINIRHAIDWFEGHSIDKLWNLGIKNFYPEVKRIGYESFRSFPYYLSTFPIKIEKDAGTIPDVFAAQGSKCVSCIREFLPEQEVIVIPAFKYVHVWQNEHESINEKKQVLVAFPISLDATIRILESLITAYLSDTRLSDSGVDFILKPHPKNSIKDINQRVRTNIPKSFRFTEEKSFPKILKDSSLLVTEASSTCLEAMAYGISVIVIENTSGLTYDPIPSNIDKNLYRKTRTEKSLTDSLIHFLSLNEDDIKHQRKLGLKLRRDYFEPVTKQGIFRFLDMEYNKE